VQGDIAKASAECVKSQEQSAQWKDIAEGMSKSADLTEKSTEEAQKELDATLERITSVNTSIAGLREAIAKEAEELAGCEARQEERNEGLAKANKLVDGMSEAMKDQVHLSLS
jgi:chromosome segregation ATPase